MRFVADHRLLVTMALIVGGWQMCHQAALVVQILFATRTLGLSEGGVGLAYVALGVGTIVTSTVGNRVSRRFGPGPTLVLGFAICGIGWLLGAAAPPSPVGIAMFGAMLMLFGVGAVLIFITFLALRQSVTPAPLLGRMTSTMRWLILLPAGPGALLGGWLGEHLGLRAALAFAGVHSAADRVRGVASAGHPRNTRAAGRQGRRGPRALEQRPLRPASGPDCDAFSGRSCGFVAADAGLPCMPLPLASA